MRTFLRGMVAAIFLSLGGALLSLSGSSGQAPVPPGTARVVYVVDGDSFEARFPDGTVGGVRLIGVNAPEMADEREDVRYLAFLAKRFASHHLSGKTVTLEYDWNVMDIHGRLLAYVRPPDKALFNLRVIREGFAYAFLRFPFRRELQEAFTQAQRDARRLGKGIWAKDPPPQVGPEEAGKRGGAYIAVSFTCAEVRPGRQSLYLRSEEGLEVVVSGACGLDPKKYAGCRGRKIVVKGVVEKEKGRVWIQVCFSRQLQIF